ncbi:unnamed protein product [Caenorhabditis sp. 36 PRJEB53466]|nr:unnamed protein product [Caenorhabditis sp. 36 PRJEB53466]
MVRIDRDLKRCYFYRLKVDGNVNGREPINIQSDSLEFPKSASCPDIIPVNPYFRPRSSRQSSRASSNRRRRISWSREADRVRQISPKSEPEHVNVFSTPQTRTTRRLSDNSRTPGNRESSELMHEHFPKEETDMKKKKKSKRSVSAQVKPTPKSSNGERYKSQKLEHKKKRPATISANFRKFKSNANLRVVPKEPLMKKAEHRKTKHLNPPRWRHVGDRNRHHYRDNKTARSFVSDHFF